MRRADDELIDRSVYLWFIQARMLGSPVSGPLIQEKATSSFILILINILLKPATAGLKILKLGMVYVGYIFKVNLYQQINLPWNNSKQNFRNL